MNDICGEGESQNSVVFPNNCRQFVDSSNFIAPDVKEGRRVT